MHGIVRTNVLGDISIIFGYKLFKPFSMHCNLVFFCQTYRFSLMHPTLIHQGDQMILFTLVGTLHIPPFDSAIVLQMSLL